LETRIRYGIVDPDLMARTISTTSERSSGSTPDTWTTEAKGFHIAAIIGRFQITGLVARTTVVAVFAAAGTGVGHLEGDDDGASGGPIGRATTTDT
jgi:hypothetical protein